MPNEIIPAKRAYQELADAFRDAIDKRILESLETIKPQPQQPSRWQMKRNKWLARHA